MNEKVKLPEYWPILEPENIHRGDWSGRSTDHGECHCWLGWLTAVSDDCGGGHREWSFLVEESQEFLGVDILSRWNDRTSKKTIAERWNEFGRHLGYDVDHPEDA